MADSQKKMRFAKSRIDEASFSDARNKIGQIFKYLRALHALKMPTTVDITSHPWILYLDELSNNPAISIQKPTPSIGSLADESNVFKMSVSRPNTTKCPDLPSCIRDWVPTGWDVLENRPITLESRNVQNIFGQTRTEIFDESRERVEAFESWLQKRRKWEEAEFPSRHVFAIFSRLFDLYSRFEREAEKYQLWLADGHLEWKWGSKVVSHPLIIKKVEIHFDPKIPSFSIVESLDPPELHTEILRYCELDGRHISDLNQVMKSSYCHPLGGEETNTYLKHLIHTFWEQGELDLKKHGETRIPSDKPIVTRRPVLFLGSRNQGFDSAMSRIESYLEMTEDLPESLMRIIGLDIKMDSRQSAVSSLRDGASESGDNLSISSDIMLTKPANGEQVRVIRKLAESGSVIVQGPPGTGKTHTIANLIGHLLADGKTVLVTSHTAKALRVVRDKVHDKIRPLCVSVLESDENSRRELEQSISGIVGYLSRTDISKMDTEISILAKRRSSLINRHNHLVRDLLAAKRAEYEDLVCGDLASTPSVAARYITENPTMGWIPIPVAERVALPLTHGEVLDLYATNIDVTAEADLILAHALPDVFKFPLDGAFAEIVDEFETLRSYPADSNFYDQSNLDREALLRISKHGQDIENSLAAAEPWLLEAILGGVEGGAKKALWQGLAQLFISHRDKVVRQQEVIIAYGPTCEGEFDQNELASVARQIAAHLEGGGKIGKLSMLFNSAWKNLIEIHRVNGKKPSVAAHFHAIAAMHETCILREEIKVRWTRQMEPYQAPNACTFGENIEDFVFPFAERIFRALRWCEEVWEPFLAITRGSGLDWQVIEHQVTDDTLGSVPINRIKATLATVVQLAEECASILRRREIDRARLEWIDYLSEFSGHGDIGHPVMELRTAIETLDHVLYKRARRRLADVTALATRAHLRRELIFRLEKAAPGWANAIRMREEPHHMGRPPGNDIQAAWIFRQWFTQLASRHLVHIDEIQRNLIVVREDVYRLSAQYVEALAWRAQMGRTGLRQRQALLGWLDIQRKIGKGTGKRVPLLQEEARKLLVECKDAVPVWIMPTSRVYETFDPTRSRFDVLILDEASQCDVTDLALLSMADNVVVVGDHEQVSPYAVGQDTASIQSLIDEFLVGIPNAVQYDPKTSVYDIARQSFGETIRLAEHFRCVPDIISFSNALSYSGEIRPLRESGSARIQPPTIAHRVIHGSRQGKVNLVEVDEITSLILAADEHDAYDSLTFGVISMVGIDQALRVEESLRRHMAPDRYSARRVLCGNASQFQGDERDVIFISMVDSAEASSGPLPMRDTDDWRKIFNVAASRARDQLWVVHSLNPDTDLKNNDVRKRLIKHVENPAATMDQISKVEARSESEFERLVGLGLTNAGFRIQMQWVVGAFRIDMVVYDREQRRIALECDGDRWHPPEKHGEDLARQFVLERLGWKFVRIRGSEFFADRESALRRLIARITDFGIEPDLLSDAPGSVAAEAPHEGIKRAVIARAEVWREKLKSETKMEAHSEVPSTNKSGRKRGRKVG